MQTARHLSSKRARSTPIVRALNRGCAHEVWRSLAGRGRAGPGTRNGERSGSPGRTIARRLARFGDREGSKKQNGLPAAKPAAGNPVHEPAVHTRGIVVGETQFRTRRPQHRSRRRHPTRRRHPPARGAVASERGRSPFAARHRREPILATRPAPLHGSTREWSSRSPALGRRATKSSNKSVPSTRARSALLAKRPTRQSAPDPPPIERAFLEIAERQRTLDADDTCSAVQQHTAAARPAAARTEPGSGKPRATASRDHDGGSKRCRRAHRSGRRDAPRRPHRHRPPIERAGPRGAIEALENQVRGFAERLHDGPNGGSETNVAGIEHSLAEIRNALQTLRPPSISSVSTRR